MEHNDVSNSQHDWDDFWYNSDPETTITWKPMPSATFDAICDKFANEIVDGMDMDTLIQIAYDQCYEYFKGCSDNELKEEVINHYCGDESEWDRIVEEVAAE